jgi:hypothetical protein
VASWLPQDVGARAPAELDWWRPAQLEKRVGKRAPWGSFRYIVVDELEQGVAGLVVSPWPHVDERGRLHFGEEEDSGHVTVDGHAFRALLEQNRKPVVKAPLDDHGEKALRTRKLAIGDVFAARVPKRFARSAADPAQWMRGDVYDITALARTVAKGQTRAALAGVIDDTYLEAIGEDLVEGRGS